MVYLITGKAGAGKTHYANALAEELKNEGKSVVVIDGDIFRKEQGNDDFSDQGRVRNLLGAAKLAQEFEKNGAIVIMAFIAPKREWRELMRSYWKVSRMIYIPGGSLWEGTIYEKPTDDELSKVTNVFVKTTIEDGTNNSG